MTTRGRAALALGLSYLGFVSLGLPDGLLGVAAPSLRASFGAPIEALGSLLVAFTLGYLASSFASGAILARFSIGTLLAASCLATGTALLGYALAPVWGVLLVCGVLLGLGAGAIDAGINGYVAERHGPRTLNWLHACYGIGAASGPLLMTATLMHGRSWRAGYAVVALAQLALAAGFALLRRRFGGSAEPAVRSESGEPTGLPAAAAPAAARETLRLRRTRLGIAAFFLYTGLEGAAGLFAFALLHDARGLDAARAGAAASAFWASLTLGRLAIGAIASRYSPAAIVRGAILAMVAAATLLVFARGSAANLGGFALLGFAMGPVFPTLIAATPARLGAAHSANGVGFQIAGAVLGQSLLPALGGFGVGAYGLEPIPLALLAGAVALALLHERLVAAGSEAAISAPGPAAELTASG